MASIKITDLDAYSDPKSTDVLPAVDVTNDETKKVSIADLMENAGSGTESAPGIAFDGDPNTGIYRPGADQLAISTAGTQRLLVSATGAVTIPGNLTVQGTTTFIDSETLQVEDKNIEIGKVASPTDTTADGGGITLLGSTNKTLNWVNSTDSWTSSENVDLASGKTYKINGTDVLSGSSLGSGVTGSSLTSVGTITSGTWNGTPIATAFVADDAITADKLANTAVTAGSYTAADITVDAQGRITAAANGTLGTAEIADLAITTAKIADDAVTADKLANTAVTAGSYTAADITVDAQGRITAAASGSVPSPDSIAEGNSSVEVTDTGSNGTITFTTEGSPAATIDSSGNLGVGITTPSGRLDARGTANGNALENIITFGRPDGAVLGAIKNGAGVSGTDISGVSIGTTNNHALAIIQNDIRRIFINTSGNVGISTASPQYKLDVYHASNGNGWALNPGNLTTTNSLYSLQNSGAGLATARHEASDYHFFVGNSEAARIDSSGRLLVGTGSSRGVGGAARLFQVEGTSGTSTSITTVRNSNDTGGPTIILGKTRATTNGGATIVAQNDQFGSIQFAGADGNDLDQTGASITAFVDGTPGANDMPGRLVFSTTAGSESLPTERMRIDSSGRVGIGTTLKPWTFKVLEVGGASLASNSSAAADSFISANAYYDGSWKYRNTGVARNIYMNTDGIVFRQAASGSADGAITWSEHARIGSNGCLGLGTSSPSQKLHIVASSTGDNVNNGVRVELSGTATFENAAGYFVNTDTGTGSSRGIHVSGTDFGVFSNGGTNYFAGNVGIGTTSPGSYSASARDLVVGNGAGQRGITIASATNNNGNIFFADGTSGNDTFRGYIQYSHNDNQLRFGTNATQQAVISSSGNFQFNSGYGSVATAYGCRAWVNFTGTGTVTIKGDGNVTSITDHSTGTYSVNFTNNMPDANYAYTLGARDVNNGMGVPTLQADPTATPSTSALKLIYNYPHDQAYYDAADACVAIFR